MIIKEGRIIPNKGNIRTEIIAKPATINAPKKSYFPQRYNKNNNQIGKKREKIQEQHSRPGNLALPPLQQNRKVLRINHLPSMQKSSFGGAGIQSTFRPSSQNAESAGSARPLPYFVNSFKENLSNP